jgi:hypothetical protein
MSAPIFGHLRLGFDKDPTMAFLPLLQKGVYVDIRSGNLLEMLCQTCGLDAMTVQQRIQTVFLNGRPVDDMAKAYVQDQDCLALSAAMPGLVGATMRSGGVLASFRHSISHRPQASRSHEQGGVVLIKLFNLLIRQMGLGFLQNGILVKADDLQMQLAALWEHGWQNCQIVELNGQVVLPATLKTMAWPSGRGFIHLRATIMSP